MSRHSESRPRPVRVVVVIPALDEAVSIGRVIGDMPVGVVDETIVVDNGSTDTTAAIARRLGCTVVTEPRKGYGYACLAGMGHISKYSSRFNVIVVFMDADHSDTPGEMEMLLAPILAGDADMVVGSRMAGEMEEGAMYAHARLANIVICNMMSVILGRRITDLGPFRAIRYDPLSALCMKEKTYGWTTEMTTKAVRSGLRVREIPVTYRKRIGSSKISGGLVSSLRALACMVRSIFIYSIDPYHYE